MAYDAFAMARIDLHIDPVTGTIPIDSSLLYGTDEYEVTEEGKAVLRDIFGVYCSVLSQEKYRGFVSRIVIVGHTDTAGSYDYNLELSQKRAEAVRDFCLSDECGIENVEWLRILLDAEGHSYDEPVYEADGSVNMDASRRVEIQFKIDLE